MRLKPFFEYQDEQGNTYKIFQFFGDNEGTKDKKRMMVYWVISGHFMPPNRRRSELNGSKCDCTDGQHI